MRKLLCIAGLAMSVLVTCNYDEGACWIDGQGDGAVGAGGGPILPPGAGGFGDVPPEPQDASEQLADCNNPEQSLPDDGATELDAVTCGPPSLGIPCMELCALAGRSCAAAIKHPKKADGGTGQLAGCCSCKGTGYCKYVYSNGDVCYLFPERALLYRWTCAYEGGK